MLEYNIDEDKFIVIMVSKPEAGSEVANSGDNSSTATTQPRLVFQIETSYHDFDKKAPVSCRRIS